MMQTMVNNYVKQRKLEMIQERGRKYDEIKKEIDRFYLDLERIRDVVDIPYYLKTAKLLNEKIKTDGDIDYYYNRLMKWRKENAAKN